MDPELTITWRLPTGDERVDPGWTKLNLLGHADTHDLELPQACGGYAECGTCRVRIISGEVTPIRHEERELMTRHAKRFRQGERLACQARPLGDVVVEVLAMMPRDLRDEDIEASP
jgi:ferredoxin